MPVKIISAYIKLNVKQYLSENAMLICYLADRIRFWRWQLGGERWTTAQSISHPLAGFLPKLAGSSVPYALKVVRRQISRLAFFGELTSLVATMVARRTARHHVAMLTTFGIEGREESVRQFKDKTTRSIDFSLTAANLKEIRE